MPKKLETLDIDQLIVNPDNDRHGKLPEGITPINWMLKNKGKEIRNLASDIVNQKEIYEIPLVEKTTQGYLVWDGNRRTTALKLLNDPSLANNVSHKKYFTDLSEKMKDLPEILCEVQNNSIIRDEMLDRRHSGSNDGIGQMRWDSKGKHNFNIRTGITRFQIGHEVRKLLLTKGLIKEADPVRTSNIDKILLTKELREMVGVAVVNNQLQIVGTEDEVLRALNKIAQDTITGDLNLTSLLRINDKKDYLNKIKDDGYLPNPSKLTTPKKLTKKKTPAKNKEIIKAPKRMHLIRRENEYNLGSDPKLNRFRDIWRELQYELKLEKHINAISVLTRVLFELAIDYYIEKNNLTKITTNDKLDKKIKRVANELEQANQIDTKSKNKIISLCGQEEWLSTRSMHGFVHSSNDFPSPKHVTSIFDNIDNFILNCIQ